jgi:hypothetical protein
MDTTHYALSLKNYPKSTALFGEANARNWVADFSARGEYAILRVGISPHSNPRLRYMGKTVGKNDCRQNERICKAARSSVR